MIEEAKKILKAEAEAILNLNIDNNFELAINEILNCKGKLITTGLGKAGYIARKAASTFSTTGSPSIYLHPADSSHGDVGVISSNDILLAISNSGGTREVIETVLFCKSLGVKSVIGITGNIESKLAELSDTLISIGKIKEPCPLGMTPSASASAMLALCDCLALVAMKERGFSKEDFAKRHHGGYLGEKSRNSL